MSNITQWQHFKKNYLGTSLFLIGAFIVSLIMEIVRDSNTWWISFVFLFIATVIIPIANYFSWRKKQ